MKPLTLSKIFPYLLNFPSTSSNLVTCLALYKEDQATHQGDPSPLSSPIFWNFTLLHIFLNSSLQKYLFLKHTITHYPSLPHFNILKLHHFAAQKHIPILFFISHTKSLFLENNITNDITQKNHSNSSYNLMYLR